MRIATGALGFVALAAPLGAQVHVETGGGTGRLDQLPSTSLTALGGGLDAQIGRARLRLSGGADNYVGLGVTGSASAAFHLQLQPGGWRIEFGPGSDAARGIGEQWSTTVAADLRVERDLGPVTIRGGWQQGIAWLGSQATGWHRPELGADYRFGKLQFSAAWRSTVMQDSVARERAIFPALDVRTDTLGVARVRDIQDFTVRLSIGDGPLSLDAKVGRRYGATLVPQTWWEGHAQLRLTPVISLTMRSGQLASDLLLGLRGGGYTSLGLRLDLLQRVAHPEPAGATSALVQVVRISPSTVHLYFTLPTELRQVTMSSDLTDWRPVSLARTDDGRWEIVVAARPGVHRLNIRTDNGPWQIPPGLPVADDGFGGKVGLLVVEQ